ncbi:hypothetical protein [Metabacillus sp. 22489]|uniref:hypothetical protein n=1 Tax=Metabacillus sp. 22489 TaxID=3453928 RepID=UPI003F8405CC
MNKKRCILLIVIISTLFLSACSLKQDVEKLYKETSKYTNLSKEERKEIVRKMNDRRLGIDNKGNEG